MDFKIDWKPSSPDFPSSFAESKAVLTPNELVLLFESKNSEFRTGFSGRVNFALHCNNQTIKGVSQYIDNFGKLTDIPYELTGSFLDQKWLKFEGIWRESGYVSEFLAICVDDIIDDSLEEFDDTESSSHEADLDVSNKYRWSEFRAGLKALEGELNSQPEVESSQSNVNYSSLEIKLTDLRIRTREKLQTKIEALQNEDRDNPAFLPFSLLQVLDGTGLRETAHTRILAWLFDPKNKEKHGFSDNLFIPVLHEIMPDLKPEDKYSVSIVEAEKSVKGGRIDIWIEGSVKTSDESEQQWLIVIEAKVEADVRDGQLKPYEEAATIWQDNHYNSIDPYFVLLTKHGTKDDSGMSPDAQAEPSTIESDDEKEWQPLSFLRVFELIWPEISKNPSAAGFHVARSYLAGILSDINGWTLPLAFDPEKNVVNYDVVDFCDSLLNNSVRKID